MKTLPSLLLTVALLTLEATQAQEPAPTAPAEANGPNLAATPDASRFKRGELLQRHTQYAERAKQGGVDVLFLGDSITARWMGKDNAWANYFGKYRTANFGISGDETQHLLWRIQNGEAETIDPKLVVLLIGSNNLPKFTAPQVFEGIQTILREIETRFPHAKILLFGIFPRQGPLKVPNLTQPDEVNALLEAAYTNDDRVLYRNINQRFLNPDGTYNSMLLPDGVHLSPTAYSIWAESITPVIEATLTPNAQ